MTGLRSPFDGPLDRDQADQLGFVLKAIASPARLQILSLLWHAPDRELSVIALTERTGLSQPTVSHHLQALVGAGVVAREQQGRFGVHWLDARALRVLAALLRPPGRWSR